MERSGSAVIIAFTSQHRFQSLVMAKFDFCPSLVKQTPSNWILHGKRQQERELVTQPHYATTQKMLYTGHSYTQKQGPLYSYSSFCHKITCTFVYVSKRVKCTEALSGHLSNSDRRTHVIKQSVYIFEYVVSIHSFGANHC